MNIEENEAHVWLARTDDIPPSLIEHYMRLLCPEERGRYYRLTRDRDRLVYLLSRVLLRTSLSRYGSRAPGEWTFRRDAQGKPALVGHEIEGDLLFNLSRTEGISACLVTRGFQCGVDVEATGRRVGFMEIAKRFFSDDEYSSLSEGPADVKAMRFFGIWTLKEAYLKALGVGLGKLADSPSFMLQFSEDGSIAVRLKPEDSDSLQGWSFLCRRVPPNHLLAAALGPRESRTRAVSIYETAPLAPVSEHLVTTIHDINNSYNK